MAEETVEKSKHSIKINCVKLSKYTYIFIFLILIKVYLDSIHPTSHVCDSVIVELYIVTSLLLGSVQFIRK